MMVKLVLTLMNVSPSRMFVTEETAEILLEDSLASVLED